MTTSIHYVLLFALSLFLLNPSPNLIGQTTAPKAKKLPFHGKIVAVDSSAETITLSGKEARVFHMAPTTKITNGAGEPTTFAAAVVGEDVGGSYTKDAAGTLTLASVRFGAKLKAGETAETPAPAAAPAPAHTAAPAPAPVASTPEPAAAAPAAAPEAAASAKVKKQTFSGKVVSVDASANTLVVHGHADQTFTVTPTTKIVDSTGAASTLAAATAGTKVTGSYSKSADGTVLTVYTLKIGK